jgi:lipopolysaccharide export system permease protein
MLAPFFASLVILCTVLFMGKLVPFLETIFDLRIGLADFIRICLYITPNLLLFAIPMASMMAVIISFTRLTADNEILAFKAGGIGLSRMAAPVVGFALFTALFTGFVSTQLIPDGTVAMKRLLFQLTKEKIDRGLQARRFSEGIRDVVLFIDTIDRNNGQWQGVYVSDLRERDTPVTIFAQTGDLQADLHSMRLTLSLRQGTMHRSEGEISQTIGFQHYTLTLPLQQPQLVAGEVVGRKDKGGMSQSTLLSEARLLGTDSPAGRALVIEFHKRLALPVGCLILTLLSLPLALRSRPGRRPLGLPLGLTAFVLYYVLLTGGKSFADSGVIPVFPAMWTPNLLFAIFTIIMLRGAARETTSQWLDMLLEGADSMGKWLRRPGRGG